MSGKEALMNCDDLNLALIDECAVSPLPLDAQEHLNSCRRCQELVIALTVPIPADQPSRCDLSQIERRLVADLRAVRPVLSTRYLFVAFGAIFVSAVSLNVHRLGAFGVAAMSPLQASIILGALTISTWLMIYSLVHQMVPGSRHRVSPELLPIAITISLMVMIAVLFRFQHERDFWAGARACLMTGTPIGFVTAVPFWLVLRRGAVLSPIVMGAGTGLLSGLVGMTTLEIHCPNLDGWHILISHLGVPVLCSIAGLALGVAAETAERHSANGTKGRAQLRN
jgi:hypothetical protein